MGRLVSGVAAMVIGYIWYGPLFGNAWMRGMGWDPEDQSLRDSLKKKMMPAMIQQFIGALLAAYVLAHVIYMSSRVFPEYGDVARGLNSAFWSWVGFVLPVKYGDSLWSKKSFKYVAIDLGYWIITLSAMGLILSCWR